MLEKLLKAVYVKNVDIQVPRIHNLLKISRDSGLTLSIEQENFLLEVTTYNIKGRYPDYKHSFHRKANKEFTSTKLERVKEMRKWIQKQLT